MTNNNVSREYREWLKFKVGLKKFGHSLGKKYTRLFEMLYNKSFIATLELDENRCDDGKNLRWEFEYEQGYRIRGELDGPCTVLEVILSLAIKYASDIGGGDDQKEVISCFWRMIDNLHLLDFTDEVMDSYGEDEVDDILEQFIDRGYGYDGTGGLFPLDHPKEDQRNVELWYQMSAYLIENHADLYL